MRHSFASLAAHLRIPEPVAMEIGGWADSKTMRNIYTHVSKLDIANSQNDMAKFYNRNFTNELRMPKFPLCFQSVYRFLPRVQISPTPTMQSVLTGI